MKSIVDSMNVSLLHGDSNFVFLLVFLLLHPSKECIHCFNCDMCFVNSGDKADLFTGVFFNHYNPPDGFCFDIWCNDDPIQVIINFTLQCSYIENL